MLWGLDVLNVDDEAACRASGSSRTAPLPRGVDRFHFVDDGQTYELTILHTGKQDWGVYDRFLDSFAVQE